MPKITSPNPDYIGISAGVAFAAGKGETDNESALAYFRRAGYGIEGEQASAPPAPAPRVDARAVMGRVVLSEARDAAVDPRPEDFLPPINAGQADPHGPSVVAPGIHGLFPGAIVPGDVSSVPATQEARETAASDAVLVRQEPNDAAAIAESVSSFSKGEETGDGAEDRSAGESTPSKSASKAEWVDYAVSQGMARDEAEDATKADLQERFG